MNLRTRVFAVMLACVVGVCQATSAVAQYGSPYGYAPPAGVPAMPPPPASLAPPPMMSSAVSGPFVAMQQPPVVVGPPVAQGFGSSVAPVLPAQPQPYYTPLPSDPSAIWYDPQQYVKFLQSVRLRYTWLAGDTDPSEFGVNDIELAGTFAWNNFIFTQDPLLITPGFILSLWDPPSLASPPQPVAPPGGIGELPSQVYAAYLDFYWTPHITEVFTAELGFRIGVYSDFESVGSDAVRPQAYLAGIWQVSPTVALKGGAAYINRVDIQILPVLGLIWTPNQFTHFDITFPNPKLSHYGWTWGATDIWWYLAAEYGGGCWEIDNAGDARMDMDDIRAIFGLEWTGGFWGSKGFVEVGYVFNRELVFDAAPGYVVDLDNTFMLRGGLSF